MLSRLRLKYFRNYRSLDISFADGLTLLTGANGQGKTNILEAIHYLSVLRSFRTRKTSELKQWDKPFFFVEGTLSNSTGLTRVRKISISYADSRRLRVDRQVVHRAADFIGCFRCVACVPEDIMIVKGSPGNRRRFLDMLLCQHSQRYLSDLMNYQAVLKARNRMLKEPLKYGPQALQAYDKLLAKYGAAVIEARRNFSHFFSQSLEYEGRALFGPGSEAGFCYSPNIALPSAGESAKECCEHYAAVLEENRERDRTRGRTNRGPHVDDYRITLNGVDLNIFGSEGQCRMMSLALKFSAVDYLTENTRVPLIMLVDDVLGELDNERRNRFFSSFEKATQVIVACTDAEPDLVARAAASYQVKNGRIEIPG